MNIAFLTLSVLLLSGIPGAVAGSEKDKTSNKSGAVEAELHEDQKDAFKNPSDASALPRILIIGDSISIGYTLPVRKLLDGKALVFRPSGNCQDSGNGLKNLENWLGKSQWDVIHFNFGIWDTHYLDIKTGQLLRSDNERPSDQRRIRNDLQQYRANLVKIVERLKQTKAQLIWAQTTPIMFRTGARFEDIAKYNAVAAEVMKENGVTVSDLYGYVLPNVKKWQNPDQCHFNDTGNQKLAEHVMDTVLVALEQKKKMSIKNDKDQGK